MIGRSDDPAEAEADQLAQQVMRMQKPLPLPMRKAGIIEPEESVRTESKPQVLHTGWAQSSNADAELEAPKVVRQVIRSQGKPLDGDLRNDMEARFGYDFSQVRVHTDHRAAISARAVGAHAYTVGTNVVFGRGEFAPGTDSGRKLIAHELVHVIQQADALAQVPVSRARVQRDIDEDVGDSVPLPASSGSKVKDISSFKTAPEMDIAEGESFAREAIAKMSPYGAVIATPFSESIASLGESGAGMEDAADESGVSEQEVQTSALGPIVQRSGGGRAKPEAGFVGSIQFCYNMCNSEITAVGWIWAGGGVVVKGPFGGQAWWGAYVFAEKEFLRKTLDFMPTLSCGTCAAGCKPDETALNWGAGISGFPLVIKPGERSSLKQAGIEVGVLLSPHPTRCDADLELIALVDLTKYLGPLGAAVVAAEELANKLGKKFDIQVECGIGVDVSGAAHLCKSVAGGGVLGVTSDSAKICGGGYIGCGIGLAHDKSALPGI